MARDAMAPPKRAGRWGLWLLTALLALSGFLSVRPVMRLRSEPPAEFLSMPRDWNAKRRAAEQPVARAYWKRAVQLVGSRYRYGTTLPANPPPEFAIDDQSLPDGSLAGGPATRIRYWTKLREVWPLPQAWERSYEWSTDWVFQTLLDAQQAANRIWGDILRDFRP